MKEFITLDHKFKLLQQFENLQLPFSEYSFANLFLFRKIHDYTIEGSFIRGKTYDKRSFLMPLCDLRKESKLSLQGAEFFYPISDEWLPLLPQKAFTANFSSNDSDYIFKVDTFKYYAGRHLDGRRNLVHQLMEHYSVSVKSLTETPHHDLMAILDHWNEVVGKAVVTSDCEPCKEALTLLEPLSLFGLTVYCDGKPAGFIIGEKVHKTTCIIHFAKADVEYKGIYQYMYQAFAQQLDNEIVWINLEQDLGDEGLHHSKSAYHPEKLLIKMRVSVL